MNKNKWIILIIALCSLTSTSWAWISGSAQCTYIKTFKCVCGTAARAPITWKSQHCYTGTFPNYYWQANTHKPNQNSPCGNYPNCKEDN